MKRIALVLLGLNLVAAGFFLGAAYVRTFIASPPASLNVERLNLRGVSRTQILATAPPKKTATTLCVEWRGLEQAEFVRVREVLKDMTRSRIMSFTETPMNVQYWVIFPPLPSRGAAQAKVAELRAAGVTDIFLLGDGALTNALSLGLYGTESLARKRIRELEEKGVHGTRVQAQPKEGTKYYFLIRSEDADALKNLDEVKAAYPESALTRVGCHP